MAWREASSVIVAAFHKLPKKFDYHLLCLKRSDTSSFYPSGYVFPGGAIHPIDESLKWFELFDECNIVRKLLDELVIDPKLLTPLFHDKDSKGQRFFPKQLSLRITAIRETFEESGVLLCRPANQPPNRFWANTFYHDRLNEWRTKIISDGNYFFDMCKSLKIYPDLWGLHLWSSWLTPSFRTTKRFDTSFYLACLQSVQNAVEDEAEVTHVVWQTPDQIMDQFLTNKLYLPPPQFYEIGRLINFERLKDLQKFAIDRSGLGCNQMLPVLFVNSTGLLALLPGDEDYPVSGERYDVKLFGDRDFSSMIHTANQMHRMTVIGEKYRLIVKNFQPPHGHLLPKVDISIK